MGSREEPNIEAPQEAASITLHLFMDGTMSMEFTGALRDSLIAEHMLKKALQHVDDEKFQVHLKARQEMEGLVKVATPGALNGVNVGRRLQG